MLLKNLFPPKSHPPRAVPWLEKITADTFLRWFYLLPNSPHIEIQGMENIPGGKAIIFCMENPDPAQFIPFMLGMYKHRFTRYSAYWAPHHFFKYLPFRVVLPRTNNLPVPGRTNLIERHFKSHAHRAPTPMETQSLLRLLQNEEPQLSATANTFVDSVTNSAQGSFRAWFLEEYIDLFNKFQELHRVAMYELNLNVIAFTKNTGAPGELPFDQTMPLQTALIHNRPLLPITLRRISESGFSRGDRLLFTIHEAVRPNMPHLTYSGKESASISDMETALECKEDLIAATAKLFPAKAES